MVASRRSDSLFALMYVNQELDPINFNFGSITKKDIQQKLHNLEINQALKVKLRNVKIIQEKLNMDLKKLLVLKEIPIGAIYEGSTKVDVLKKWCKSFGFEIKIQVKKTKSSRQYIIESINL